MRLLLVEKFLLSTGVALLPVYVFASGGVQPAHIVMAIFSVLVLFSNGVSLNNWSIPLLGMALYSLSIDSVYVVAGGEPQFLMNGVFFLYNFAISCAVYLHCRSAGLAPLVPGFLVATGVAVATVMVSGVALQVSSEGGRATGAFNNPNQLGYFSVCLLSLTYLFYRHGNFHYLVAAGVFAIAIFLSVASLSKAAMISNFLVAFLALKPAFSRTSVAVWLMVIVPMVLVLYNFIQRGVLENYFFMIRLAGMWQESDSSLASRGYFAFWDGSALQWIFGLGAEKSQKIVGHEVHSTLASVLNNYGLVGLFLFGWVLAVWGYRLWRAYGPIGTFCLMGPAMLYGITHNGTRFTIFWLLFSTSIAMASRSRVTRAVGKRQNKKVGLRRE